MKKFFDAWKAKHFKSYNYILQLLLAIDQLCSTLIPGGWADETLSARCYRMRKHTQWNCARKVVNFLFKWQTKDHCYYAYLAEVKRTQSPVDQRSTRIPPCDTL